MSFRAQIQRVKKQLACSSCSCAKGEPQNCDLPTQLKDCPCWWGKVEECKALLNGKFTVMAGVKVFWSRPGDPRFDHHHPHRSNPLQNWALTHRNDPFRILPADLEVRFLSKTNGKPDLLFGTEARAANDNAATRSLKGYFDPRTGFDYGIWPVQHNGVEVRDPAECALRGTVLEEVQKELERARLSGEQQLRYYQAALEAQKCEAPSFNYPDIFKSGSKTPRAPPATIDDSVDANTLSAPKPEDFRVKSERIVTEWMDELFRDAEEKAVARHGFPLMRSGIMVPHPRDYYTIGIQGLFDGTGRGVSRQATFQAMIKAGMTVAQRRVYMQAADEIRDGLPPSFDYATILARAPSPVEETRPTIKQPANATPRFMTRAMKRRIDDCREEVKDTAKDATAVDNEGARGGQQQQQGQPAPKRRKVAAPVESQVEQGTTDAPTTGRRAQAKGKGAARAKATAKTPAPAAAATSTEQPAESQPVAKKGKGKAKEEKATEPVKTAGASRPRRVARVDYTALLKGTRQMVPNVPEHSAPGVDAATVAVSDEASQEPASAASAAKTDTRDKAASTSEGRSSKRPLPADDDETGQAAAAPPPAKRARRTATSTTTTATTTPATTTATTTAVAAADNTNQDEDGDATSAATTSGTAKGPATRSRRARQPVAETEAATTAASTNDDEDTNVVEEKPATSQPPRRSTRKRAAPVEAEEVESAEVEAPAPKRPRRKAPARARTTPAAAATAETTTTAPATTTTPAPAPAAVPAVAPAPAPPSRGAFVSTMAEGFDRTVWPDRPGVGRYPAYISKRGVKHMDDACKYIDNGRNLTRRCEMNARLAQPYPQRDLFIARDGKRCSYCTSKNFGPKQCDANYVGRGRKDESRHN